LRQEWKGSIAQKAASTNFVRLLQSNCTTSVFPGRDNMNSIFLGYKLIDKPVQNLYGLVLQSRQHSIPVASDCQSWSQDGHSSVKSLLNPAWTQIQSDIGRGGRGAVTRRLDLNANPICSKATFQKQLRKHLGLKRCEITTRTLICAPLRVLKTVWRLDQLRLDHVIARARRAPSCCCASCLATPCCSRRLGSQ